MDQGTQNEAKTEQRIYGKLQAIEDTTKNNSNLKQKNL
jgi:hypothetical protein